jgi:prolyl 4-hydroxylase
MEEQFTVTCQVVHRNPDIVYFRNVLNKDECEQLIGRMTPKLARSTTFSGGNDPRRTSSSAFTNHLIYDPVVDKLTKRCAVLCGYPVSHVEPPQVVRYLPGEMYVEHCDNYEPEMLSYKLSGQRDYTFFIYLNEPTFGQTGGETFFPKLNLGVRPERGMAVFWRNINIPDRTDANHDDILHQAKAPEGWTKYGMNLWIRSKPWIG